MDSSIVTEALGGLQGPFATINGIELTAGAAKLVIDAIGSMSDKSLKAKRRDLDCPGLDANAVRARLIAAVRTNAALPAALMDVLRQRLPASKVIDLFSESFIDQVECIWPNIFGQHAAGLAMILDGRPEVRKTGQRLLVARPDEVAMNIHEAREILLREIQAAFLGHVATFAAEFKGAPSTQLIPEEGGEAPNYPKADVRNFAGEIVATIESLETANKDLIKQLQDQSAASKEQLAFQEKEWASRLENERARSNRIPALEEQIAAGREREQQLLVRLIERERTIEEEVKTRVERELSAVVRPWLEEARRLEGLSADRVDKCLDERVRAVLHAQEALDMKFGSRTRLRRRLKDFEGYEARVRSALEDSLKPSKDLAPLLSEIESEIQRTRVRLGEGRPPSQLIAKLVDAVHKAESAEKLDALVDHISGLHQTGIFLHQEHVHLTKQTNKAYDRLQNRGQLPSTAPQRRSGRELCLVLGHNRKATVYFDGNNVVHRDDRYAHLFDEPDRPNEAVEDAFLGDVYAVAAKCPDVIFRVVFDSHQAIEESVTSNVILQRSGGSGKDRADSAIVLHLSSKKPEGEDAFVITDDIDLRHQTTRYRGVYADVSVWAILLEGFAPERVALATTTGA